MEIFIGNDKGEISAWDLRNGQVRLISPRTRAGPVHSISINAEGTSFAAVNSSGDVVIWSLVGGMGLKPTQKVTFHSGLVYIISN